MMYLVYGCGVVILTIVFGMFWNKIDRAITMDPPTIFFFFIAIMFWHIVVPATVAIVALYFTLKGLIKFGQMIGPK